MFSQLSATTKSCVKNSGGRSRLNMVEVNNTMSLKNDDAEIGRVVGGLAKSNPKALQILEQIKRSSKKRTSDILAEALEIYDMYYAFKDIDPKSFIAALQFLHYMLNLTTQLLAQLMPLMGSSFVQAYLQSIRDLLPEEKPKEDEAMRMIRAQLIQSIINMITNLVAPQSQAQASQPQITTSQVKVSEKL